MANWQQILAVDAKYNAYRAPSNPHFRKFKVKIKQTIRYHHYMLKQQHDYEWHSKSGSDHTSFDHGFPVQFG